MGFILGFIFGIICLASVICGVGFFYMYANREMFPHGNYAPIFKRKPIYPSSSYHCGYGMKAATWTKNKGSDDHEPESDDELADTDEKI